MKIGYPCINTSIGCTSNRTFRLKSYSEEKLRYKIRMNLKCLEETLIYNQQHNLLFFRMGSGIIPFASHPICKVDWADEFQKELESIGNFTKKYKFRISMHPDQFVVINSPDKSVVERSIAELEYHSKLMDTMKLDSTCKIQIHVGGKYGDIYSAMDRFMDRYSGLDEKIKKRLAIENDDRLFSLRDCLHISKRVKIPVIFDTLHHECNNNNEPIGKAMESAFKTWKRKDGIPMIDYSSQKKGARKGSHTESIDTKHFRDFLEKSRGLDFDLMLEIKDKEKSALKARKIMGSERSARV